MSLTKLPALAYALAAVALVEVAVGLVLFAGAAQAKAPADKTIDCQLEMLKDYDMLNDVLRRRIAEGYEPRTDVKLRWTGAPNETVGMIFCK